MARDPGWSDEENSILVRSYLDMLRAELRDERFVKAEVNRQLQAALGRGRGSIEFKLANVSAVLRDLDFPFVPDGTEKLIEVKTTRRGAHWPMLITRNEVDVSVVEGEKYHLYRLHDFTPASVRFYRLQGDLVQVCQLLPETFSALPTRADVSTSGG